jgi:hypothetical protein
MDGQSIHGESGSKRPFRFGLRLMLLIVALACVLAAYYRASADLQRARRPLRLRESEYLYDAVKSPTKDDDPAVPLTLAEMANVKAEIDDLRRQLHRPDGDKK